MAIIGHFLGTHSDLYKAWWFNTNQICLLLFSMDNSTSTLGVGLSHSKMNLMLCQDQACKIIQQKGNNGTPCCYNFSLQD